MIIKKRIVSLVFVTVFIVVSITQSAFCLQILVRPFAGVGYSGTMGTDGHGGGYHAGGRFLLEANKNQRYGIEVSYMDAYVLSSSVDTKFIPIGFVLEQKLFGWFNMAIGTIGYIGIGANDNNPFGVVTNLGWEPTLDSSWTPFITYRAEFIFDNSIRQISSISCGCSFTF